MPSKKVQARGGSNRINRSRKQDEVKDSVESKIKQCLNNQQTHDQFILLMEMDAYNNDKENYIKIFRAALSILERKESLLTGIVKSVISQMASSTSAHIGVKTVASLMQVAEIAKALHEVANLTEQLQDKLAITIADLSKKAQNGDLASAIQKKLTAVDAAGIKDIVTSLEQQGYVSNNRIIKIENIEQTDFKNYNYLKEYIVKHVKKLYEAQNKDYSQAQAKLTQDLTAYVSKAMMGTIRSEIMMPAASSPLAKLSQMVTDGIARTAAEFSSVIRTEAMVIKNANQIRGGQYQNQAHDSDTGVGAGDEDAGGLPAHNKAKGSNLPPERGGSISGKNSNSNSNNNNNQSNNNNEWQNPDAALMHLMTDPAKLTALRNQREGEQRAQREVINPETANYLNSVLYLGSGSGTSTTTSSSISSNSRELSSLAKKAETIRNCIELAEQYPNVIKYGAPALSILAKGVSGAIAGSAVPMIGTAAGFAGGVLTGVQNEVVAQGINAVAGEKIGELATKGVNELAALYKFADSTLTDEQAQLLAMGNVFIASSAISVKAATKDLLHAYSQVKPKMPDIKPTQLDVGKPSDSVSLFKNNADSASHHKPTTNKPDIIKEVSKVEVVDPKKSIDGSFVIDDSVVNAKVESIVGTKPFVHGGVIESAALEAQIIAKGSGVVMAGVGHIDPIKDIKRIIATYGGNENQWVKMTSEELNQQKIFAGGKSRQLHWYQNLDTGMIVEVKVKSQ